MNSSVQSKNGNMRFFFIAVSLSLVVVSCAGFLGYKAFTTGKDGLPSVNKACLAQIKSNNFTAAIRPNGVIAVSVERLTGLAEYVYKSGVLIASCPAHKLTSYCAGEGCEKPGVSFELTPKD